MNLKKNIFLKSTIIFAVAASFFIGYFFRENSVGGGPEFYDLSWPIIQSFKNDFLFTIKNYGTFGDATIPFSHILNAYINPFSNTDTSLQLSITIISFCIFLIFSKILKRFFSELNYIDIYLISSVFLLLPFFRTSAFWGKNENFGWLFLIIALYFFFEIKKNIYSVPSKKGIFNIVLFCFTSACALYARQALVFLPISYLLYLFVYKANIKIIKISIISFIIFAIPGLLLIITWGDIYDTKNLAPGTFIGLWNHPKYIIKSLIVILSFIGFYLLPILFIEFYNLKVKFFFKQYYKSFLFCLIIFILLYQINFLDYLGNYKEAGGAVLKLNYLIMKGNFFLLLIFSAIGFSILIRFFLEDKINNVIILLPMLFVYASRNPAIQYQEYFEPLVLIIFFLALKTNLHKIYFKNISFSNFIFISYFAIYLAGSIYFKHFAFESFEKWNLFLNTQ